MTAFIVLIFSSRVIESEVSVGFCPKTPYNLTMNYRKDKHDEDISILGYGCMRFTTKAGKIDIPKAAHEIGLAIENGVNYFDTAYIYPGNEVALGQILEENEPNEFFANPKNERTKSFLSKVL